jgi:hypothetical protein
MKMHSFQQSTQKVGADKKLKVELAFKQFSVTPTIPMPQRFKVIFLMETALILKP